MSIAGRSLYACPCMHNVDATGAAYLAEATSRLKRNGGTIWNMSLLESIGTSWTVHGTRHWQAGCKSDARCARSAAVGRRPSRGPRVASGWRPPRPLLRDRVVLPSARVQRCRGPLRNRRCSVLGTSVLRGITPSRTRVSVPRNSVALGELRSHAIRGAPLTVSELI